VIAKLVYVGFCIAGGTLGWRTFARPSFREWTPSLLWRGLFPGLAVGLALARLFR
jgi:hypothetical protein